MKKGRNVKLLASMSMTKFGGYNINLDQTVVSVGKSFKLLNESF